MERNINPAELAKLVLIIVQRTIRHTARIEEADEPPNSEGFDQLVANFGRQGAGIGGAEASIFVHLKANHAAPVQARTEGSPQDSVGAQRGAPADATSTTCAR